MEGVREGKKREERERKERVRKGGIQQNTTSALIGR